MRDGNHEGIVPEIEHAVDEIWDGSTLEQHYNYLDYHFEQGGAYLRARAYLDDMGEVTLFGPFKARGSIAKVKADAAEQAALTYLHRRYGVVKRL
jgi:hypothetical protein